MRSSEEAILCLLCERDVSEALEYFALGGRAVGLLVFDAAPNRLASLCLPCLVIREELSPCALDGHIALIDLERSRLLLDPGLEALSEYARRDEDGHSGSRARLGRLCSAHELSLGGDIFEGALGFLESDTERGLCVSLELSRTDRERLRGESEALFLAAVYGEISIMLSGFDSAGELFEANALLHSVFCELEAEGKIYCRCEKDDAPDDDRYEVELCGDGMIVSCRKCGAKRHISTDNSLDFHAFLDADALYLE